jgi:hypothetical protein
MDPTEMDGSLNKLMYIIRKIGQATIKKKNIAEQSVTALKVFER